MRILFILNPVAGGKKTDKEAVRQKIRAVMAERGESCELYETVGLMDAAEKVKREAIKGDELRVIACGGDGTLSECAHGAAGFKNAAVTHYPCGTGNDFVRMFGPDAALFSDLDALLDGKSEPVDIVDVNGRKCLNIASIGIDARVGLDVHKYSQLPVVGGAGGYVISLLVNVIKGINSHFRITVEGEELEGQYALICACNGQYYGGGFNPSRIATPEDGAMDILIVNAVSRFTLARLLKVYASGRYATRPDIIKYVSGRHLTVEDDREFGVSIDGEALYTKRAVFRLIPGGVNLIYPKGCRKISEIIKMTANAD